MKFLDPTNDVAFRKVFADENHKEVLISFLNAVLGLSESNEIIEVEIDKTQQHPPLGGMKEPILDVRCRDKRGVIFIVEMQVAKQLHFDKRLLFYASRAYTNQLATGDDYPKLNQVIMIVVTDFELTNNPNYLSRHLILDKETGEQLLKDFEFFFVELPKFSKTETELGALLDKWVFFLKNAKKLEETPPALNEKPLLTAFNSLKRFNWTLEEFEYYEKRGIYQQDEIQRALYQFNRGKAEGKVEGKAEGKAEIIINLRSRKKMSDEEIADFLDLPLTFVQSIT